MGFDSNRSSSLAARCFFGKLPGMLDGGGVGKDEAPLRTTAILDHLPLS
jgi:hypothetical protein